MVVRHIVPFMLLGAFVIPWPLVAQSTGSGTTIDVEAIRAVLLHGLEQHKQMDIEFTRAIPDSALRWKPTPEVRDFAQQIHHIAVDNANFVVWGGIREMTAEAYRDQLKASAADWEISDFHYFLFGEGDYVTAIGTWKINQGLQMDWVQAFRIEAGRIVETWLPAIGNQTNWEPGVIPSRG